MGKVIEKFGGKDRLLALEKGQDLGCPGMPARTKESAIHGIELALGEETTDNPGQQVATSSPGKSRAPT